MHLLYVVLWADHFVHENKSISFYQPFLMGLFGDFVQGMVRKQNWQRQAALELWLAEAPSQWACKPVGIHPGSPRNRWWGLSGGWQMGRPGME